MLWRQFRRFCVAYVCLSVPMQWAFESTRIISGSMAPTLQGTREAGDTVLVDLLSFGLREPKRGELVSFVDDDGVQMIKRVVGLPGEEVAIAKGRVLINREPLTEPAAFAGIHYYNHGAFTGPGRRFRVQPGHYFVLGDDSKDSYDSRYWGGLRRDRIQGRAVAIVWPPTRAGLLRASKPGAAGYSGDMNQGRAASDFVSPESRRIIAMAPDPAREE